MTNGLRSAVCTLSFGLAAGLVALMVTGCGTETCGSQEDCSVGFYCKLSLSGGRAEGACEQDCESPADCPQPESSASRAVCANDGRCAIRERPVRIVVLEPEPDVMFEEGTRRIRVTGEVEMAGTQATVMVTAQNSQGCGSGIVRQVTVENTGEEFRAVPFVIDDVLLDSGASDLTVQAFTPSGNKEFTIPIGVDCPGCARVNITDPRPNDTAEGLSLMFLQAAITPNAQAAIWRVQGLGGVMDGTLPFRNDRYILDDVPLFPGLNQVEVVVSGVGSGRGEARCTVQVNAGVTAEAGLRAILTWDGPTADLDLHLVGDGGQYGDPTSSLSSRTRNPIGFSGQVDDDFDGLGPEVLTVASLPDGTYGLVVEAVFDDRDPGSTAFLRVLYDGRTLTAGPIGPQYLQAIAGDLWVAGVVEVSNGQAAFRSVDERAVASSPPTTAPSAWPVLF